MKKNFYFGISITLLILSNLSCTLFLPRPSQSSPAGIIVYQSDQDGNYELYSIRIQGGTPARLTDNTANDYSPTYIQSTQRIGFASDRHNGWNLYTMDLQSNDIITVTNSKNTAVDYPNWSIDGEFITLSLAKDCTVGSTKCNYDIYTMDADGSNPKNLTNKPGGEWVPMWSPDGNKVAFSSDMDTDVEIFVIDRDGLNLVQLTDNTGYDGRPSWSPDGTKIAFESDREDGDWDIYIMNADGSNPKPVTNNMTHDYSPAWSPDGKWIVYVSNNEGDNEIFIVDINGQNQRRITNNTFSDLYPVWIP